MFLLLALEGGSTNATPLHSPTPSPIPSPIPPYQKYLTRSCQNVASWQEICSKSMPTFQTCKNLSYPRFLFQIHAKILYCLISGQILEKILPRFFSRSWQEGIHVPFSH